MVNFTNLINSSSRIIDSVGRDVFIERNVSTTDANSSKPWLGKTDNTERHKVTAAFVNFEDRDIDGTSIKVGDQMCFVSPKGLSIEITNTDKIIDGDNTWIILAAKSQKPGNDVLIYHLHVRS